jgi:multiple sugar transport system ATP-binding protein
VVFDGVDKVYENGVQAVYDLSLEARDGEFLVLVGPSGCGKTTALRMVAGLEEITKGAITIGDRVVNDVPPKERDIAMVFQNYALYPHMTVFDNMAFGLKLAKCPKEHIEERVHEAARILGLDELLKRKPAALSGGQRQRVAMGRAIVRHPQAFLMDEPLSNLDAKLRVEMRAEISRLQRDLGVTTIYVTHDQVEAMTMGDRVAVMRSGLLQQIAVPKELYERPRNLFVAEFIGSPAMNLVMARVERTSGDVWAGFGPHRLRLEQTTLERHPGLRAYEGRNVVLGIRPEDMEDAAVVRETHPDRVISVVCDIREDMGAEVLVHFNVQGDAVTTREVVEALVVEDAEDEEARIAAGRARGEGVTVVAGRDPSTEGRVPQPHHQEQDVTRLHFFDPETGARIEQPS